MKNTDKENAPPGGARAAAADKAADDERPWRERAPKEDIERMENMTIPETYADMCRVHPAHAEDTFLGLMNEWMHPKVKLPVRAPLGGVRRR